MYNTDGRKIHFCFDRACTAQGKKRLLILLVLVLMDLNRRLDGRGSNRWWTGYIPRFTRLQGATHDR